MKRGNEPDKILALDDEAKFLAGLKTGLEPEYMVRTETDVPSAMKAINEFRPDVLLLDVNMGDITGLQVLKVIRQRVPHLPVIMLTSDARTEIVVNAMKAGANDYVVKGPDDFLQAIRVRVGQLVKIANIEKQNQVLTFKVRQLDKEYEILGNSISTISQRADISKLKDTDISVLILGENGTGKELIARNLNIQEGNPSRPFIDVNCGAIPANLFESELFGHVKGAFTGAAADQTGKFVQANGGDIFLDEIGELPLELQVKLLRVLQNKVVTPVGSNKSIRVDVRVIAATNKNLENMVREGKFREDLYYRINKIPMKTTPLRERKDDIPLLAQVFAEKILPGIKFKAEALEALCNHPWPGNIRQLNNVVERTCIMIRGNGISKIGLEHIDLPDASDASKPSLPPDILFKATADVTRENFQYALDWMQKTLIVKALELFGGNNQDVIDRLGFKRATFFNRKRELGIGNNEPGARWM